ncbi:DUF1648 domain-containing protein [Bacillus sp. PS06]|uniref:DUF1648 domain-containing protein n=1 Tax=Bacillus sp. PS06 TaxID=2764176 RepID=UPI001781E479|nr:DUF1648 domain-containing protein [Bacillus sp. PS06]MBD8070689.1 DUF1648 domain-containing protein [Bacillus sp. PS06]
MSNSPKRPKISLSKTKTEWIWDIIGYSFYLGSLFFLISNWNVLPDQIPSHFNTLGEVDRWGSKMELIVLPIIGAFITLLMILLEKFPESHNYPERLSNENAKEFYLVSRKLVNQLKNISLIIFAFILFELVSIALGKGTGFGVWFLPIAIVSVLIPIVLAIIKQKKIR